MELFQPPKRTSKACTLEAAAALVRDGDTVAIGSHHSHNTPSALIRALVKRGAKDLTVVTAPSAGYGVDLLIAAGCIRTLHISYLGLEFLGLAPNFRHACERGEIDLIEGDEAWITLGLRAGAAGLPFIPIDKLYESTDLPKVNRLLKKTIDPYSGREVFTIPALRPHVAIVHAQRCSPWGDAQLWSCAVVENLMAKASDITVVSTDEITPEDLPVDDPLHVTIPGAIVKAVVEVPYGAHPTSSPGIHNYDEDHLREYSEMGKRGRSAEYIRKYITEPADHIAYLEALGVRSLMNLRFR